MKLPTFDEFMAAEWPNNAYVREPGFKSLYVRKGQRRLEGRVVSTIELPNTTVTKPGQGTFTRFVARLRREYPAFALYAECVLVPRLPEGLMRLGFKPDGESLAPSFYMMPVADVVRKKMVTKRGRGAKKTVKNS